MDMKKYMVHKIFRVEAIYCSDMSIIQNFSTNQIADDEIIIVMRTSCHTH